MTTPTQTQPPFIPLRRSGWATRRTPLWVFAFLAVAVAGKYGVDGLPQTFFLNAKHQIVDHVLGAVTEAELAKGQRLMNSAS